jgi:hypothetical protein
MAAMLAIPLDLAVALAPFVLIGLCWLVGE